MNEVDALNRYVAQLRAERDEAIEFIVLFGSRARGDWSRGSDYDVLIGLKLDEGQRLIDRMPAFSPHEPLDVEPFPYSRSEWRRMFRERHPLLLEAMAEGVVLWDSGAFAAMRGEQFRQWERDGLVESWRNGWKIAGPSAWRVAGSG